MRVIRFVLMFLVLAFALFLSACAGGGSANTNPGGGGNQPPAPTASILASATSIIQGDSVILNWTSTNATSCRASGSWSGGKALSGSETVTPQALGPNTFGLDCQNSTRAVSTSVSVTVNAPQPTVSLQASAPDIFLGESIVLTWSSTNASRCDASGDWSGVKALMDQETITPTLGQKSYGLDCSGPGGTASASVDVSVNPPPLQITQVSPRAVKLGYASDFTLRVSGQSFVPGATIQVNDTDRATFFVSSTELTANMPAIDAATRGELTITVANPDGAVSNVANVIVDITVSIARIPTLKLTDLDPKNLLGAKVKAVDGVFGDGKKAVAVAAANGVYLLHDPDSHLGSFIVSQVGNDLPGVKFFYGGPMGIGTVFYNIARAGDLDNDGIEDFLISVITATDDPNNKPGAGIVFAVRGGSVLRNYTQIDLNNPPVDIKVVVMRGPGKFHFTGQSMADGMDFNRDDFSDIAFSAPGAGEIGIMGYPGGVSYLIYGRPHFFDLVSIDLLQAPRSGDAAFVRRTTSSGYGLGSVFPGSDTIQFISDRNNDKFPELIIGDPFSENGASDREKAYVVFGAPLRGTFFISDVGVLYAGVTFVADQRNACHFGDPNPCYSVFGTTVAGGDHSLVIASPDQGVLGSTLTNGTVFISEQTLTSGQVIDVIAAVQSQQATSLWDMNSVWFDQMGLRVVDGPDVRLISFPGFDENRGKLLFVPASGIARGNLDIVSVTTFTLTGENRKDLFSHSLARTEDGSILVGARSFTNANPGKAYYIPAGAILF